MRALSERLSTRVTAWQSLVITLLWLYTARNFAKICGLESPEPLANLYTRAYFRATWFATALDAGFWTAVRSRLHGRADHNGGGRLLTHDCRCASGADGSAT